MWRQFVKDYLSFTKGERRAVLVLLALVVLFFILPYWWRPQRHAAPGEIPATSNRDMANGPPPGHASPAAPVITPRLFYFDPNTLAAEGWQQLGLRDKTIRTILHYREKGGYFRHPEDIGKIYGLLPADYARLLPYVKIKQQVPAFGKAAAKPAYIPYRQYPYAYPPRPLIPRSIDINTADSAAFIALPGIGSRLANRIINFRDKLGGFYSIEQVGETYALPDSTFQQIKGILHCDSYAVRRININTADANTLRQHPYIRWNIANAIVAYRGQHGDYTSVDELLRIEIISPDVFQKIRPYLSLQ